MSSLVLWVWEPMRNAQLGVMRGGAIRICVQEEFSGGSGGGTVKNS